MAISPQITNLVIILGMMQVSKRIPMEDPDTLNLIRGGYVLSNVIILAVYAYVHFLIQKKKDMTTLKYVEQPQMGSTEEPKLVTTTVHRYDLDQMKALYKAQLMGVGMMAVMHLYFKYTNPLLIQSIIPLKGAFEGNEVKIHLFGQSASGDLKRPFKAAAGLMSSLQGGTAAATQDKKTIEAAEKESEQREEEANMAVYEGYNKDLIDRFVNMGFDVDRVVSAFKFVGIDRMGGEDYELEEAYMGDITARLLGEP